jgi:hypothetical protein
MISEEEEIQHTKDMTQSIDEMTDPLWIRDVLLPQISIKAVLKNIPITDSTSLVDVMQRLLSPIQHPQKTSLLLSEPQKTALKVEQEKDKAVVTEAINRIKQLSQGDSRPSEQALITLLEPYRKILFSPVKDPNGNTLLETAQQTYKTIIQENTKAAEPEWKKEHHSREIQLPFRVARPKTSNNSAKPTDHLNNTPEKH